MKITEIDRDEAVILIRMADAYLRNVYNEYEQMEVDHKELLLLQVSRQKVREVALW